jgi:hypothetical protein
MRLCPDCHDPRTTIAIKMPRMSEYLLRDPYCGAMLVSHWRNKELTPARVNEARQFAIGYWQ